MDRYLLGIDVGGTNVKIMIMTDRYRVFEKCSIPTHAEDGYEKISDRIIETIRRMFSQKGVQDPAVLYIAMGLPGTVDRKNGKTVRLNVLHWDGFDPAEKIGRSLCAPTVIENDANINALGEYAFGENGRRDLALLTLGTGVGGGVIIDGKIFGGTSNLAAELGHMVIVADGGARCLCGRRGHLEAYCSGTALMREARAMAAGCPESILNRYMKETGGAYDNSMVTRGAAAGDAACIELMDQFIHYLAAGVTNVMNFYNPEIVVIGGGISNAGDMLLEPLNRRCREMAWSAHSYCPVVKASLGSEAGMYGACALAGQQAGIALEEAAP